MGQITLPGNPSITVTLRRSARSRRLSLRLSQLDGRVTLTLPNAVPESEGRAFLREKEAWLRRHLAQRDGDIAVAVGAAIPVEGVVRRIEPVQGRRITLTSEALLVPQPVGPRLQGWLRSHARDRLAAASDRYARSLGRPYTKLTLRDTRSRWGSCTSAGGLMYSWRLILAPPEVLDYVAAHEVAHLAEMNHSAAFWKTVEQLYGDWRQPRGWLRKQGASLHRYRFEPPPD